MVTVALAGATTGFGLTVLRNLLSSQTTHHIVLLSRTPQPELASKGVDVRRVDYTDHNALIKALDGVHTVLSLIGGSTEGLLQSQLALLEAAKVAGVERFAPSEYAGKGYDGINLYAPKAVVWEKAQASGMQYTRFDCGIFMNGLATGTTKPASAEWAKSGQEEALAGLRPWNFVINMKAGTADLPGDGRDRIVFTEMNDVARFVIAALDMEKWPETLGMRGDVKTCREVVETVEIIQGRKFLLKENSVESMAETAKEQPARRFYEQVRVKLVEGWAMVGRELNDAYPEIKPVSVEEFVEKWWRGEEVGDSAWAEDAVAHRLE